MRENVMYVGDMCHQVALLQIWLVIHDTRHNSQNAKHTLEHFCERGGFSVTEGY